jgi:hypothetical protein
MMRTLWNSSKNIPPGASIVPEMVRKRWDGICNASSHGAVSPRLKAAAAAAALAGAGFF